jgi:cytidyltransferase-like protein
MKKIVLVTGGFDPCHSGHIEYFKAARALGDMLVVGINSDEWLIRKKGQPFMSWHERNVIVSNITGVDATVMFDDSDNSAVDAIRKVKELYPDTDIVFANGGDRTVDNIPEMTVNGVVFKFGVGGEDKKNSSSWILQEWKAPKTERPWGYYRVLHEVSGTKVKELTVNPGKSLSMQRHAHRAEHWHVTEGQCVVNRLMLGGYVLPALKLITHATHNISVGEWHQLTNPFNEPCKIVEIQYGDSCVEEDIERK